jgi:energy-coupling factor transporter ATP-binding protein EcfA2
MPAAVETSGLTKRYGDVLAVDGVTLRVGRGEVYGFLGLNGAGKTTTIRALLGMVRPTGGAVRLLGKPVSRGLSTLVWWQRADHARWDRPSDRNSRLPSRSKQGWVPRDGSGCHAGATGVGATHHRAGSPWRSPAPPGPSRSQERPGPRSVCWLPRSRWGAVGSPP